MKGWIYILSNPSFSGGQIKIGKTAKHPSERASELFTTGLPTPFYLEYTALVANHDDVELTVHSALSAYRPSNNESFSREFFTCGVPVAISVIREISEIFHEEINYKSPTEIAQEEATRAFENDVAKIEDQFEEEFRSIDDAHQNKIAELSSRISGPSSVKQKMWLTWGAAALLAIPTSGISLFLGALFSALRLVDDLDQAKFDAEEAEKQREKITKQWELSKKEAETRKRKALLKLEHAHDDHKRRLARREDNAAVTDQGLSTKADGAAAVSTTVKTITSLRKTKNDHVNHPAHPDFNDEQVTHSVDSKDPEAENIKKNRRQNTAVKKRDTQVFYNPAYQAVYAESNGSSSEQAGSKNFESDEIGQKAQPKKGTDRGGPSKTREVKEKDNQIANARKPKTSKKVITIHMVERLKGANRGMIAFKCGACRKISIVKDRKRFECSHCKQKHHLKFL